jgi:DNA-binding response OmpR family regulator
MVRALAGFGELKWIYRLMLARASSSVGAVARMRQNKCPPRRRPACPAAGRRRFFLDTTTFELQRDVVAVPMEPQAFDVIAYGVWYRDGVGSKQELLDQVWVIGSSANRQQRRRQHEHHVILQVRKLVARRC